MEKESMSSDIGKLKNLFSVFLLEKHTGIIILLQTQKNEYDCDTIVNKQVGIVYALHKWVKHVLSHVT